MHIYKCVGAFARSRYTGGGWWGLRLVLRLRNRGRASSILRCRLSDFSAMVDLLHSLAIYKYVVVWWVCMSVCVWASGGRGVCMLVCMYVCTYVCMHTIHICTQACTITHACFVCATYGYTHTSAHKHFVQTCRSTNIILVKGKPVSRPPGPSPVISVSRR